MALTGPEGETHSYIAPQDRERVAKALAKDGQLAGEPLPDRGHWVGPRGGSAAGQQYYGNTKDPMALKPPQTEDWAHRNGLPLEPPESTLPERCSGNRPDTVHVFLGQWFETQFGPMPPVAAKLLVRELLAELDKHHWAIHYK